MEITKTKVFIFLGVLIVLALAVFFLAPKILVRSYIGSPLDDDSKIEADINKAFTNQFAKIGGYPSSGGMLLEKGSNSDGVAFAVRNTNSASSTFEYTILSEELIGCEGVDSAWANGLLSETQGTLTLGPGETSEIKKVVVSIPSSSPSCSISYRIDVNEGYLDYTGFNFLTAIK